LEPYWDPATFPLGQIAPVLSEQTAADASIPIAESDEQPEPAVRASELEQQPEPLLWEGSGIEIVRFTRSWIQYGTVAFAVLCIVIGAVEGLFGR
jgi:hypothetical protein